MKKILTFVFIALIISVFSVSLVSAESITLDQTVAAQSNAGVGPIDATLSAKIVGWLSDFGSRLVKPFTDYNTKPLPAPAPVSATPAVDQTLPDYAPTGDATTIPGSTGVTVIGGTMSGYYTKFSMEGYKDCASNGGAILKSEPPKCVSGNVTYVYATDDNSTAVSSSTYVSYEGYVSCLNKGGQKAPTEVPVPSCTIDGVTYLKGPIEGNKPVYSRPLPPVPAPAVCKNIFTSELGIGAKGEQVMLLQKYLGLKQTGSFDPDETPEAVVDFQTKYGIRRTGYVGPITLAQLNKVFGCNNSTNSYPTYDKYPAPKPMPKETLPAVDPIDPTLNPSTGIKILSPLAGEVWPMGKNYKITWASQAPVSPSDTIYFFLDNAITKQSCYLGYTVAENNQGGLSNFTVFLNGGGYCLVNTNPYTSVPFTAGSYRIRITNSLSSPSLSVLSDLFAIK